MSDPLLSIGMGGLSDADSWLGSFDAAVKIVRWGQSWGARVAEEMAKEAPYRESEDGDEQQSEHLRDSIAFAGAHPVGAGAQMTWTSNVGWAAYVVEGTEAHEIHAAVAKALHWQGEDGDQYAVSVMHPGTKPNPFPLRAFQKLEAELLESLAVLFEEEE